MTTSVTWRVVRPLLNAVVTLAVIIGLWFAVVKLLNLDPLLAKTPADVWDYLMTGPTAAADRSSVFHALGRTLLDASYGFVAGLAAAVALALSFVLRSPSRWYSPGSRSGTRPAGSRQRRQFRHVVPTSRHW